MTGGVYEPARTRRSCHVADRRAGGGRRRFTGDLDRSRQWRSCRAQDPPGFKIDDCTTQRNLDDKGRAQARALGAAFRQHGVRVDKVLSSPYCRCLETAELLALGPVDNTWAVAASDRSPERLAALKQIVSSWRGPGTLVIVTHALTVQALVGIMPGQAETVVLRPKRGPEPGVDVAGRIPVPE